MLHPHPHMGGDMMNPTVEACRKPFPKQLEGIISRPFDATAAHPGASLKRTNEGWFRGTMTRGREGERHRQKERYIDRERERERETDSTAVYLYAIHLHQLPIATVI